jgi:hypothetical protein
MNKADTDLMQTETQPPPATPDISADAATGWADWAVVAAVLAVALWYLFRKLWAQRGGCGGCDKGNDCAVRQIAAGTPRPGSVEVKLDCSRRGD